MAFYMDEAGTADLWGLMKEKINKAQAAALLAAHSAVGVGGGVDYSGLISVTATCKAGYWGTANAADVTETEFAFNLAGLPANARLCFLGDLAYKTDSNGSESSGKGNFDYYIFVNGTQIGKIKSVSYKGIRKGEEQTVELRTNIAAICGRALTKADKLVVVERITAVSGYTNASDGIESASCELRGIAG